MKEPLVGHPPYLPDGCLYLTRGTNFEKTLYRRKRERKINRLNDICKEITPRINPLKRYHAWLKLYHWIYSKTQLEKRFFALALESKFYPLLDTDGCIESERMETIEGLKFYDKQYEFVVEDLMPYGDKEFSGEIFGNNSPSPEVIKLLEKRFCLYGEILDSHIAAKSNLKNLTEILTESLTKKLTLDSDEVTIRLLLAYLSQVCQSLYKFYSKPEKIESRIKLFDSISNFQIPEGTNLNTLHRIIPLATPKEISMVIINSLIEQVEEVCSPIH